MAAVDEVKQQRGRDVVGQVADDPQGIAERTEVEFEGIRFVNRNVVDIAEAVPQRRCQVAVEFDAVQFSGLPRERFRDGSLARADLDDRVARLRVDRPQDILDDAGVVQEVLTKALARPVRIHRRSVSCAAIFMAATRLLALALPLPARSNAVP